MTTTTTLSHGTSLVEGDVSCPYLFVEHVLDPGSTTPFRHHLEDQRRSFVLIDGAATVEFVDGAGRVVEMAIEKLAGWHAPPGSAFRVHTGGHGAVIVEAGVGNGPGTESAEAPDTRTVQDCTPISQYTVDKPWGHEVWYTENVPEPGYALKQIHMSAGNQSSLQSHRYKVETNYVVDGEATVLNGLSAPEDPNTVIDLDRIPVRVHPARTGWSSAAGILHRVIARADYTSMEVSTPELDDVIRWQDDSGRGNGRIATEHEAATR